MAVSGPIQEKPAKKHKLLSSTFCSFTPCSPLLSFVLSNEATVDQSLSFLQRHPRRLGVILVALLTLVYCARTHGFETVLVTLMSVMAALSPCSRSRHLAVSIVTLLSAPSPCCRLSHSLAAGLVALQSVSSPCCQPPHLAVGRLEICLTTLQSVSSPNDQYHHLAVSINYHHLAVVNIMPNNVPYLWVVL